MSGPELDHGQQGGPSKGLGPVKSVRFRGGYGYLTNMSFDLNGEVFWGGHEPARKSMSMNQVKLSSEDLAQIVDRLRRVQVDDLASAYTGCRTGYKLMFECEHGVKEITMDGRGDDNRPEPLRLLLEGLWATRSMRSGIPAAQPARAADAASR